MQFTILPNVEVSVPLWVPINGLIDVSSMIESVDRSIYVPLTELPFESTTGSTASVLVTKAIHGASKTKQPATASRA
jgi:hypothetical protein